jgi:selenocysteine-specific elongation factor
VRAQNQETQTARPGDRCALNLAGVDSEDVARGMWLAMGSAEGTKDALVSLEVLDDFPREVRHWLPVHVYQASAHSTGHVALLDSNRLKPGSTKTVELVTDEPMLLRRGDRLVLRDQGLDRTLGGGSVLTPRPAAGRRRDRARLARLEADQATTAEEAFERHLATGAVDLSRYLATWDLDEAALRALLERYECLRIDDQALTQAAWREYRDALLAFIRQQHEADSSLQGLKQSELTQAAPAALLETLLGELLRAGQLEQKTGRYLPAAHEAALSASEQNLLDRITPHLDQPQPPSLGDLAKLLRMPIPELSKGLVPLVAKKRVVKVSDTRYSLPQHVRALAELALELGAGEPFTVRQYRDAAGIGRNVAIEMLEYFDRRGMTRRNADTRSISGGLERLA